MGVGSLVVVVVGVVVVGVEELESSLFPDPNTGSVDRTKTSNTENIHFFCNVITIFLFLERFIKYHIQQTTRA